MSVLVSWIEVEFVPPSGSEMLVSWIELESDITFQNLYPSSDISVGSWIEAPLWSKLNSVDTLTSIRSTGIVAAEFALDNPTSVGAGTVTIEITARRTNDQANTLVVRLMEGATQRVIRTINLVSTSFNTYEIELTGPEVASIVNWNDLRIRIEHPEGS